MGKIFQWYTVLILKFPLDESMEMTVVEHISSTLSLFKYFYATRIFQFVLYNFYLKVLASYDFEVTERW